MNSDKKIDFYSYPILWFKSQLKFKLRMSFSRAILYKPAAKYSKLTEK